MLMINLHSVAEVKLQLQTVPIYDWTYMHRCVDLIYNGLQVQVPILMQHIATFFKSLRYACRNELVLSRKS